MTEKQKYELDHKIGKLICFIINTVLFILYFNLDNENLKLLVFVIANATYFFGVNTISFIIESILHHRHKHNII